MRFGVLGPLAVWTEDGLPVHVPEAKVRALLAHLLLAEGRPVPADRLIEGLWGDRLPRNPAAALQTRVSQLRRALEAGEPGGRNLVVRQPPGYLLAVSPDSVDAGTFRALAARAREAGGPRDRTALLADALGLWRGPAYADVSDEDFARTAIVRLEDERVTALEAHAQARLDLGEHDTLAGELSALLAHHPLCERLHAAHLRALYLAGRQSEALAAYERLRARLAGELGVDPGPEVRAQYEAILRQHDSAPGTVAPPAAPLPAVVAPLVGRADAVAGVRSLLASARLVTLTGPGGVGKTSLALEVVRAFGAEDVGYVDLAGPDPSSATPESVSALIARARAARPALLLLDTCEHVVEAVAEVTEGLLRAEPGLRVLATGREPLGVPGERVWTVPPLSTPPPRTPLAELPSYDAVKLFTDLAPTGFRLGPGNASAVAAICRRLDGLPLALELAAARLRALGAAELAARLDADLFAVLTATVRRAGPARQRTLRATLEWSWALLSPPERAVLRLLGGGDDGHALADVEKTAAEEGLLDSVLDALSRLVDRSLVLLEDGADGPRYRLPETVGAYLRETG
ncbi:AfsR/SARP family transcriptional regulator [Streptomyces sp. NPDC003362]